MKILYLGGDQRQIYACKYMRSKGYDADAFLDFEINENMRSIICNSSILIFPLPTSKDGIHLQGTQIVLKDICNFISSNSIVYGGRIDGNSFIAINRKITVVDYYSFEDLIINNALISAEGALYYAKEKYKGSIHGARIAVIGFGRIGKLLTFLLNSYGAKVTVFARKPSDLAWCKIIGFDAKDTEILSNKSNDFPTERYNIIFNTAPYQVMSENFLTKLSTDTLIMDLSSEPYGIDDNIAKKHSLNYYRELSIPGRYAPKSAGEIIANSIINDLNKRGFIL